MKGPPRKPLPFERPGTQELLDDFGMTVQMFINSYGANLTWDQQVEFTRSLRDDPRSIGHAVREELIAQGYLPKT